MDLIWICFESLILRKYKQLDKISIKIAVKLYKKVKN